MSTLWRSFYTALHAAAHQGHENIVEMLLTQGRTLKLSGENMAVPWMVQLRMGR